MSFWFGKTVNSALDTSAGGEATLGEIASAAFDQARYVDNTIASVVSLERAYDDRIEAVRKATGVTIEHPMRRAFPEPEELAEQARAPQPENLYITRKRIFANRLAQVAEQHPDARNLIRPQVSVEDDAKAIAAKADKRLAELAASRDGAGKWAAMFGGAIAGSMTDPAQMAAMTLGAGPGVGRTVAGRILNVTLKEALINGATEAAMQPIVQSWRKEVGLEHGFGEAMKAVGFSALIGGALGGAIGAAGEFVGRLAPPERNAAAASLRRSAVPDSPIARGLDGDMAATAESLASIREALPAAGRGALDEADRLAHVDAALPKGLDPERHQTIAAAADRAVALDDPATFRAEPDFEQIDRIASRLTGAPERDAAGEDVESLSTFLMRAGGLLDQKGEVSAIAGGNIGERFVGRLIREDGVPLDRAREMAAEAGYLDSRYGSPDEAMARSTPADLLDLLDEDLRGAKVYPGTDRRVSFDVETERAQAASAVEAVAREMGPGVPDDLVEKAVRLVQSDGMSPAEAAERVLTYADQGSAPRGGEPMPDGLDDPVAPVDPDDLLSARDVAELEGEGVEWQRLLDEYAAIDDMAGLVEACRA